MTPFLSKLMADVQAAAPIYAPLSIGSAVRLPLGAGLRGVVVDIDAENGAVICAWKQGRTCFEGWFLAAQLHRMAG